MSDLDSGFVEVQVGAGRRANEPPPPDLTPTRLRTAIKATSQDGGLISKAQLRRTEQTKQPTSGPSLDDNLSPRCRGGLGVAAASGEARSTQGLLEVWQSSQGLRRLGKLGRVVVVQSLQD